MRTLLWWCCFLFFFNDTATTEIYTLSLHDALPIWSARGRRSRCRRPGSSTPDRGQVPGDGCQGAQSLTPRSEEHTSELQSLAYLVCRLLLEKKKHARRNEEGGYHRDRADQVKHSPPAAESSDSFCLNAHAALVVLLPFFF